MTDFGNIAVGFRSAGSPDPRFVKSWQDLLKYDLQPRDSLLDPAIGMPHHVAANDLAVRFLCDTNADTLLMVDDDIVFDATSLTKLRKNQYNWFFGVVSALYCMRSYPHYPLLMAKTSEPGVYKRREPRDTDKTVKVDVVGLGFILIRRVILEALVAKGLSGMFFEWGSFGEGEDENFCSKVRSIDQKIGVDTRVIVDHQITIGVFWDREQGKVQYRSRSITGRCVIPSRKKEA